MTTARALALCLLLALPVAATIGESKAGDSKVSAEDLQALLNGNTAIGDWRGTPYKQHFATSGTTTYIEQGDPPSIGRWKVDPETGDYCSWWERSGWSCYAVEREGDGYVWVVPGGDGYRGGYADPS